MVQSAPAEAAATKSLIQHNKEDNKRKEQRETRRGSRKKQGSKKKNFAKKGSGDGRLGTTVTEDTSDNEPRPRGNRRGGRRENLSGADGGQRRGGRRPPKRKDENWGSDQSLNISLRRSPASRPRQEDSSSGFPPGFEQKKNNGSAGPPGFSQKKPGGSEKWAPLDGITDIDLRRYSISWLMEQRDNVASSQVPQGLPKELNRKHLSPRSQQRKFPYVDMKSFSTRRESAKNNDESFSAYGSSSREENTVPAWASDDPTQKDDFGFRHFNNRTGDRDARPSQKDSMLHPWGQSRNVSYLPHKLAYASRSASEKIRQELHSMGYQSVPSAREKLEQLQRGLIKDVSEVEFKRLKWEHDQLRAYHMAINNASKWQKNCWLLGDSAGRKVPGGAADPLDGTLRYHLDAKRA